MMSHWEKFDGMGKEKVSVCAPRRGWNGSEQVYVENKVAID